MKRIAVGMPVALLAGWLWAQGQMVPQIALPFYVYQGFHSRENHFIPSGWMGDYRDLRFDDHYMDPQVHRPVIRVSYAAMAAQQNGWAGIYWQHPANNWGGKPGGFNLNGAKRVIFMARGDKGDEVIDQFKIGGIAGDFADSGSAAIGPITLTKDWKQYEISLDGQELSSISGGFCWTVTRDANPGGASFELDDIRFE
ncbi:MAG TPA: hypothetical protein VMU17_05680 [Elusimicrobiota bacterium]|nr:hypothetical protein [Elusimicrobiota bacterium]